MSEKVFDRILHVNHPSDYHIWSSAAANPIITLSLAQIFFMVIGLVLFFGAMTGGVWHDNDIPKFTLPSFWTSNLYIANPMVLVWSVFFTGSESFGGNPSASTNPKTPKPQNPILMKSKMIYSHLDIFLLIL